MRTKTLLCFAVFMCCILSVRGMLVADTIPYIPTDTVPYVPTDPPVQPDTSPGEIIETDTILLGGKCLPDADVSTASLSFRLENETLYVDGTVEANCCGEHYIFFIIMPDSIVVHVFDEEPLCDCNCLYAVHEQIAGCEGEEYMLGFKNENTGAEKTVSLRADDKTGIPDTPDRLSIVITQPERNALCIVTDEGGLFDLKIYGLSGQLQHTARGKSGEPIDITSLPAGTYMLAVNGRAVRKFIKQ